MCGIVLLFGPYRLCNYSSVLGLSTLCTRAADPKAEAKFFPGRTCGGGGNHVASALPIRARRAPARQPRPENGEHVADVPLYCPRQG